MNQGPSKKATLKYLLLLYAYEKTQKPKSPYGLELTVNPKLFVDLQIGYENNSRCLDRLMEMGVIVCSDDSYYYNAEDPAKSQRKKYDIDMQVYRDCLSVFLIAYFLLDEGIKELPYFEKLNQAVNDEVIVGQKMWYPNSVFSTPNVSEKTKKLKIEKEIDQGTLDALADFIVDDMFPTYENDKDISTYYSHEDKYFDALTNGYSHTSQRVRKVKALMLRRDFDTLFDTSFAFDNVDSRGHKVFCSKEEMQEIRDAYIGGVLGNRIIRKMAEEMGTLREKRYPIHANFNITVHENKGRLKIKFSTRQTNSFASLSSQKRAPILFREGYDGEFDLHSAIYSVTRLLEKGLWGDIPYKDIDSFDWKQALRKYHSQGLFGCDWDIKRCLIDKENYLKTDGSFLSRDELKQLMFRTYFRKSEKDSLNKYKNTCADDTTKLQKGYVKIIDGQAYVKDRYKRENGATWRLPLPQIEDEDFLKLYRNCEVYCGDIGNYYSTIFVYESLLEMMIISEMLRRGFDVKNVYDCFYFKSSQISKNDFKQMVDEIAYEFYNLYKSENPMLEDLWSTKKQRKRTK